MAQTARAVTLAFAALALVACSSSSAETSGRTPGNPETYQRINSLTDCVALQAEFDRFDREHDAFLAASNITNAEVATDYMYAVDEQMRRVGCYN